MVVRTIKFLFHAPYNDIPFAQEWLDRLFLSDGDIVIKKNFDHTSTFGNLFLLPVV